MVDHVTPKLFTMPLRWVLLTLGVYVAVLVVSSSLGFGLCLCCPAPHQQAPTRPLQHRTTKNNDKNHAWETHSGLPPQGVDHKPLALQRQRGTSL